MEPDLEELFTVTKQGMQLFSEFYDYVYPFDKYDQIWVPVHFYTKRYCVDTYFLGI